VRTKNTAGEQLRASTDKKIQRSLIKHVSERDGVRDRGSRKISPKGNWGDFDVSLK